MNDLERELCLTRIVTDWPAIQGAQNALRALEAACGRLGLGPYEKLTPEEKERLQAELTPEEMGCWNQLHEAKRRLLGRYWPAVQHYLGERMRNDLAGADQVCSDFTLRFLEGEAIIARADPNRESRSDPRNKAKFRSYLKTILYRMVQDYWRTKYGQGGRFVPLPPDLVDGRGKNPVDEAGWREVEQWHREVVGAAWRTLEEAEERRGLPLARVLLMKEQNPEPTSEEVANELAAERGESVRADRVRQWVRRGRQEFAEALVAETAQSLQSRSAEPAGPEAVRAALECLGLFNDFAKAALERRGQAACGAGR